MSESLKDADSINHTEILECSNDEAQRRTSGYHDSIEKERFCSLLPVVKLIFEFKAQPTTFLRENKLIIGKRRVKMEY
jgi:hypothetical protein